MQETPSKTRQQIANLYGVDRKTLYRWLKNAGIKLSNGLVTPKEQEMIFETFGYPQKKRHKNPKDI